MLIMVANLVALCRRIDKKTTTALCNPVITCENQKRDFTKGYRDLPIVKKFPSRDDMKFLQVTN